MTGAARLRQQACQVLVISPQLLGTEGSVEAEPACIPQSLPASPTSRRTAPMSQRFFSLSQTASPHPKLFQYLCPWDTPMEIIVLTVEWNCPLTSHPLSVMSI